MSVKANPKRANGSLTSESNRRSADGDLTLPEFAVVVLERNRSRAAIALVKRAGYEVRVDGASVLLVVLKAASDFTAKRDNVSDNQSEYAAAKTYPWMRAWRARIASKSTTPLSFKSVARLVRGILNPLRASGAAGAAATKNGRRAKTVASFICMLKKERGAMD